MCCCNEPNINGQEGYSWNGKDSGIRKPYLPELDEGDVLLRDLPGRCGAIDSHCHDLRLVRSGSFPMLLVGNGAGRHRIRLSAYKGGALDALESMDDDAAYWTLMMVYQAHSAGEKLASEAADAKWRKAAAEDRIRTRKVRGQDAVKVWIEPAPRAKELA